MDYVEKPLVNDDLDEGLDTSKAIMNPDEEARLNKIILNMTDEEIDQLAEEGMQKLANMANWDLFEDRVRSIIDRWDKFAINHQNDPSISKKCIKGFLDEINDDFTQMLMDK